MSKTVRERKLDSPSARAKLKPSGKPYWRAIDRIAPWLPQGTERRQMGLAPVPWQRNLSRRDNCQRGRSFGGQRRRDPRLLSSSAQSSRARGARQGASVAVRSVHGRAALDAYFERLKHEGSKSLADARGRTKLHILPKLGTIAVADLTRDLLTKWLTGLAGGPEGGDAGQPPIVT